MQRDILFLLKPGFSDPALPGQDFYCWHCALMEGVLASFPDLGGSLDVRRIAFPRPRADVIALIGEANQSLPVLVLAPDAPEALAASTHQGRGFINDPMAISMCCTAATASRPRIRDPATHCRFLRKE